ncbi:DUF4402 domain-containing protein [Aridibaculum aurantiacum]|uniref:DUF4402 domain-containing protein n=1 Tax=Aridibaculum aurantiacum TaxID=2810307 RepID=UPI001F61C97C|nr:DUF4402 domain-containing protein [Aridibaculum aurantiacum]
MKNKMTKVVGLGLILAAFSTGVNAQASATATAAANIINPISITKNVDLNFGNVAVQASTGGTVVLTPAGGRTATSGVTLPAVAGTVTAAQFTVSGEGARTYSITLPSSVVLENGSNTMTANNFTSDPTNTTGAGLLSGSAGGTGTQVVRVGATLNVDPAQAAGAYISLTPFTVTVNYN